MGAGRAAMSQISRAILGAMAVSLTVGAVQFASGHDLTGGLGTTIGTTIGTTLGANLGTSLGTGLKAGFGTTIAAATPSGINRAAKADRAAAAVARSGGPTRTVSIRLESLADTSGVIRIPVTEELHGAPPSP